MEFSQFIVSFEVDELLYETTLLLEEESYRNQKLAKARYIDPKSGKKWRNADRWRQIKAIVDDEVRKGTDINKIWLTFSEVSKLGQRTKISSSKSTPVGIFAFPIKFALKEQDNLPFQERPYIHIFKTKKPHFEGGDNPKKTPDLMKNLEKIKSGNFASELKDIYDKAYNNIDLQLGYNNSRKISTLIRLVTDRLEKSFEENGIESLSTEFPWLKDLNIKKSFNPNEIIKNQLENIEDSHYDSATNSYKAYKKYSKVNPDLSVVLSPEFKWKVTNDPYSYSNNLVTAAKNDKPIEFQDTDEYYNLKYYVGIDNILEDDKNFEIIKKEFLGPIKNLYDDLISKKDSSYDKLPYEKKVKALSDKYGLDYQKAIMGYKDIKSVNTPNQFLYRVVQNLAKQYSKKIPNLDWRSAWNKLLRELGVTSVADTHNSGHVHEGEPTQGVFMDPSDITIIATIIQRPHTDQLDPFNRPNASMWTRSGHQRVGFKSNQRVGNNSTVEMPYKKNMSYYPIEKIADNISSTLGYLNLTNDNVPRITQLLTQAIKFYKTAKKSPMDSFTLDNLSSTMIKRFDNIISRQRDVSPKGLSEIERRLQSFKDLASGTVQKTPTFSRTHNW